MAGSLIQRYILFITGLHSWKEARCASWMYVGPRGIDYRVHTQMVLHMHIALIRCYLRDDKLCCVETAIYLKTAR
jgi:hypothetical protein